MGKTGFDRFQYEAAKMIWVALDGMDNARAIELIELLAPYDVGFKLGHERIHAIGGIEPAIDACVANDARFGIDAKLYDIPATVGLAARMIATKGAEWFNVAAEMTYPGIRAAVENKGMAEVYAVTLLTSISNEECIRRYQMSAQERVISLAKEAASAGVDGLICSALEVEALNEIPELRALNKITPGIRPRGKNADDQKRIVTPGEGYLIGVYGEVIGRPITKATDPALATLDIINEIADIAKAMEGGE